MASVRVSVEGGAMTAVITKEVLMPADSLGRTAPVAFEAGARPVQQALPVPG